MSETYDVVVIGAGPVGENVADRAVQGGLSAVVVEDRLVGGECSYWACIPSKALLRPAEARRAALAVDGARQAVTGDLDVAAVLARRTSFTSDWDDAGQLTWLESAGIDLVRGRGRVSGERQVTVTTPDGEEQVLTARHAVAVCTGSRPVVPDIPGLRDARPWTNREALEATEVPDSLLVIGGGVVASELAGAFADLGARVTMLVRSSLLSGYEPFAGEMVGAALTERGVDLRVGVSATSVRLVGEEREVECDDGTTARVAQILVATGREPQPDLGLESVDLDGGWLPVDETLRVLDGDGQPVEWLYAVGDANHRSPLTHQGKYQARAAGDVIAARAQGRPVDDSPWGVHVATADHLAPTQVVFTDPQVASVGMTAAAAQDAGMDVRVVDHDLGAVSGAAIHADGYTGQARMVVDEERRVIVGMTFVGPDVAGLLHSASIAVAGEVPLERLWHAVPAFPTMSEVWLRLLESYGRPLPSRAER
ncbi:dihydrolipoamide dehydrogenase [Georgenia satyanarayanai]|uniref:Dihydrolipoamide dehydrogenase n=1 Tax=Georgenia satyanarayanai TaxID=860221 RepID=A0A2Y9A5I7_9MICO|nr:NAD(P)/FAD-dependent oxidoreductase [Georgenia satyanarayanai]PYG00927.1 dihydrolipoamide dehydrogenase [Georgenia satyanarayanai]SSA39166.1 dihydrolipoamide dehydrogenase [Georgenia satyanarayanai]